MPDMKQVLELIIVGIQCGHYEAARDLAKDTLQRLYLEESQEYSIVTRYDEEYRDFDEGS